MNSSAGQLIGGCFVPALVHKIKRVNYQLTFAVFMQTLFFGLAALITPTNISWLMACQFFAMFPFGVSSPVQTFLRSCVDRIVVDHTELLHGCLSERTATRPGSCNRSYRHLPFSRRCDRLRPILIHFQASFGKTGWNKNRQHRHWCWYLPKSTPRSYSCCHSHTCRRSRPTRNVDWRICFRV